MTEVTEVLEALEQGDARAVDQLLPLVYGELRRLAARKLTDEPAGQTLQPTALVHEAYLKLDLGKDRTWNDKTHFQAVAARVMRQILVDHAWQRATQKRGGEWQRVTLSSGVLGEKSNIDFLALDEALTQLAALDARKAQVVELRFFGGLTTAEAAEQLGIAAKTAEADWYFARAWLRKQLSVQDP